MEEKITTTAKPRAKRTVKKTEQKRTYTRKKASADVDTVNAEEIIKETSEEVNADIAKETEADILREQNELLMKRLEAMEEQLKQAAQPTQVIVNQEQEKVHFLWQAEVADDNVIIFGQNGRYGRVVGKTGSFYVPKNELSSVLDERTRWFIDHRWLLILDGLTEEERDAYGVNYKDGEVIDRKAFAKLADLGEEILDIYPKLCKAHQFMIAQRFYEAYEKGNPHVTRDLVVKLNTLSKQSGAEKGDFAPIIEAMNKKDLE